MIVTYNTGLGEDPGMSSRLRMEMIKADLLAPKVGMFDPTAIPQTSNPPLNVQATVSTYAGSSADAAAAAGGLPDTGMAASAGGLFSTRNLAILAGLGAAYYWFFVREKPKASSPGPVNGLFGRRSRRRRRR